MQCTVKFWFGAVGRLKVVWPENFCNDYADVSFTFCLNKRGLEAEVLSALHKGWLPRFSCFYGSVVDSVRFFLRFLKETPKILRFRNYKLQFIVNRKNVKSNHLRNIRDKRTYSCVDYTLYYQPTKKLFWWGQIFTLSEIFWGLVQLFRGLWRAHPGNRACSHATTLKVNLANRKLKTLS